MNYGFSAFLGTSKGGKLKNEGNNLCGALPSSISLFERIAKQGTRRKVQITLTF